MSEVEHPEQQPSAGASAGAEPIPERAPAQPDVPTPSIDDALAASTRREDRFARGEALSNVQATDIARTRRATVVVLVGGPFSGKTTLLASVYEMFGRGDVGGHRFQGSRTLHGFEMRCFRSIHGEGPGTASGGHTASDAPPWLHLRLIRTNRPGFVYELLLGDFSGEHFDALANGTKSTLRLPAMRRADHICVTLDGAKLAQPTARPAYRDRMISLVEALVKEPKGIASVGAISFVLTKADLVKRGGPDATAAVETLFGEVQHRLGSFARAHDIGYIQTAARSTLRELPSGHGVEDLLARWTDTPAVDIQHPPSLPRLVTSAFDRYRAP